MKKLQIIVVAVTAFSAAFAATANAETLTFLLAEILVGGAVLSGSVPYEENGEIEIEDTGAGTKFRCSVIFVGQILGAAEPSHALIEKFLNLSKEEINTSKPLICKPVKSCAMPIEIIPLNLPWLFEFELDSVDGKFWGLFSGDSFSSHPGYTVKCLVLGIVITETCTLAESSEAEYVNVAGGVEGRASSFSPNGNCSIGGPGTLVYTLVAGNLMSSPNGLVQLSSGA